MGFLFLGLSYTLGAFLGGRLLASGIAVQNRANGRKCSYIGSRSGRDRVGLSRLAMSTTFLAA
jgi:hypothetical protein